MVLRRQVFTFLRIRNFALKPFFVIHNQWHHFLFFIADLSVLVNGRRLCSNFLNISPGFQELTGPFQTPAIQFQQ
jgi:hypothetical protein